jgi:hypothetical protein
MTICKRQQEFPKGWRRNELSPTGDPHKVTLHVAGTCPAASGRRSIAQEAHFEGGKICRGKIILDKIRKKRRAQKNTKEGKKVLGFLKIQMGPADWPEKGAIIATI